MNTSDKISIIVPVYNVEQYLSKCLKSIIKQSYKNLEIIIVNDGSTDGSWKICKYYAKKDKRIVLLNQQNQGLSIARNNALDIAGGDYIGFVDSDDWVELDMFSTLYENAVTYDADISMCGYIWVKDNEIFNPAVRNFLSSESDNDETVYIHTGADKIGFNDSKINYIDYYAWNKLYKRHLFNDVRFPKDKIFEDVFTTHKLLDNANKVVITSKKKYYYLSRSDSITGRPFSIKRIDIVEATIDRYNYVSNKYPHLERACRIRIFHSLLRLMYRAYTSNCIYTYKDELLQVINFVKRYNINDCGLNYHQMNMLRLLFTNINQYVAQMRAFEQKGRNMQ